jgi:hypothetical protein
MTMTMTDQRLQEGDRVRVDSAEMYERWGYRPMVGMSGTVQNETTHGEFVVILDDGRELYFKPEEISPVSVSDRNCDDPDEEYTGP